jgi:C1A family cysteine protease
VSVPAPIGGSALRIDLTDAQSHVIHSGSLHVFVQSGGASVAVAFGGTPVSVKVTAKPASFTTGTGASSTLRALVYDALGNRMIGQVAFPSPVTVTSSDGSGTITLSASTIASPNDTLALTYDGTGAATTTTLTPSASGTTAVPLSVNVVAPPHKTSNGNNSGDLIIPAQEEIDAIPTAPPIPPASLAIRTFATNPASADISASMPPMGDQGDENSCAGWASGYAIKSYQEAQEHKWSLSGGTGPNGINTNHVFSPAYIYNQINGGVDQGSNFADAFALLEKQGVAPWASMPYVAGQYLTQPTAAQTAAAKPYIISTYYQIPKTNLDQVKTYLAQGYPVFWGVEVDPALENGTFVTLNGPFGADKGGHAMTIVGYDDTRQAFKVMNSWGTAYEQGGFFWVSYDWVQNNGHMSLLYVLIDFLNDPSL